MIFKWFDMNEYDLPWVYVILKWFDMAEYDLMWFNMIFRWFDMVYPMLRSSASSGGCYSEASIL